MKSGRRLEANTNFPFRVKRREEKRKKERREGEEGEVHGLLNSGTAKGPWERL